MPKSSVVAGVCACLWLLAGCFLEVEPRDYGSGYALGAGAGSMSGASSSGAGGTGPDAAVGGGDGDGDGGGDASGVQDAGLDAAAADAGPEPVPRYAGACDNDKACADDELCVRTQGLSGQASYCAQTCDSDADCAPGPTGANSPECTRMDQCHIPCEIIVDSSCPDGMRCRDTFLFLSTGSCVFE